MIAAIALPVVMLVFIFYMFSGSSKPPVATQPAPARTPKRTGNQTVATGTADAPDVDSSILTPVAASTPTVAVTPPPTPTPTPPIQLASLAPQSVFASTGNFTLQVSGDKFGPGATVFIDGQQVPTQYKSMQQLTATVPASLISSAGTRQVKVMTPDGKLYSNDTVLNVMKPPTPTYVYVGLLKRARSNTAILKDQKGELYSVHEGDIVEGRFRIASISEHSVDVVDKDLNIKHTLHFTVSPAGGLQQGRVPGSVQPPSGEEGGEEEP